MTTSTHAQARGKETEYERLRRELEAAYAQPVWNTRLIDRLANALSRLEWASMHRVLQGSALEMAES